jgi:hypothetical protein
MVNQDHNREDLEAYRKLVLQYEAANAEINALFHLHPGGTETMSQGEIAQYRTLQHRRDELFNDIRVMEHDLLDEPDESDEMPQ